MLRAADTAVWVLVEWSRRPIVCGSAASVVLTRLEISDVSDPASVRAAELYAVAEVYGMVLSRLEHTGGGVVTSARIIKESL